MNKERDKENPVYGIFFFFSHKFERLKASIKVEQETLCFNVVGVEGHKTLK